MDRSDVITLISETSTQDENGVWRKTESERNVYCQVDSVTRDEFYSGGRNGLNPEYRFTMFGPDYSGEKLIEYKDMRYTVYRTYAARTDTLEVYVERKGGSNAQPVVDDGE